MVAKNKHPQYPITYLPTLNGWRALSILTVVACHARHSLVTQGYLLKSSPFYGWLEKGDLAILLFFVLSGFLITTILIKEIRSTGRLRLIHFYRKRFFRLLPASFTYLLVVSILNYVGWLKTWWFGILGALLFFRNYISAQGWYSGHFWSLTVEEHFYLLWPFLLLLVLPRKRLIMGTLLVLVTAIIYRELEYGQAWAFLKISGIKNHYRTDYVMSFLLWGCLLATLLEQEKIKNVLKALLPPGIIFPLIAAQMGLAFYPFPQAYIFQGIIFSLMISTTLLHPQRLFARVLESPLLIHIGLISYSLYVWQQIFVSYRVEESPLGYLQIFPVNIVAAFAFATASYHFIEKPLRRFGRTRV